MEKLEAKRSRNLLYQAMIPCASTHGLSEQIQSLLRIELPSAFFSSHLFDLNAVEGLGFLSHWPCVVLVRTTKVLSTTVLQARVFRDS